MTNELEQLKQLNRLEQIEKFDEPEEFEMDSEEDSEDYEDDSAEYGHDANGYEDWQLDADLHVERADEFLRDLCLEDREFLYHRSRLKCCRNCGEYVSKLHKDGRCYLCSKSANHARIRGSSPNATANIELEGL